MWEEFGSLENQARESLACSKQGLVDDFDNGSEDQNADGNGDSKDFAGEVSNEHKDSIGN